MQVEHHKRRVERLPPGFRFFPTDEELIIFYLARKAVDASFTSATIRDIDLYSFDPWDLPCQELQETGDGQHECCYFFCTKGSKYSSGVRARRATRSGYWKSTGKDKAVYSSAAAGRLVGTKKTLVFYGGRAPRGEKTGWVMHEYALGDGSSSVLRRGAQSGWVICRALMKDEDPSRDRKPETEETVHDQQPSPGPGNLLPMEPDRCDQDKDNAAPPAYHPHCAGSQSGVRAMDGDDKDRPHWQMAHDEELPMMNSGSSCTSPPWPWLLHDDQLGPHGSALQFMQMQSHDADYFLPELLECDDDRYNEPLNRSGEAQDTSGVLDRRAEMSDASVDSVLLCGFYWNYDF